KPRIAAGAGACAAAERAAIAEDGNTRCGYRRGGYRWRGWRDRCRGKRRRKRCDRRGSRWRRIIARRCRELAGLAKRRSCLRDAGAVAKLLPRKAAVLLVRLREG